MPGVQYVGYIPSASGGREIVSINWHNTLLALSPIRAVTATIPYGLVVEKTRNASLFRRCAARCNQRIIPTNYRFLR